jgi:hypothetical protein
MIHANLGEKDQAFEYLEKAYEQRNAEMCRIKVGPELGGLLADPQLCELAAPRRGW